MNASHGSSASLMLNASTLGGSTQSLWATPKETQYGTQYGTQYDMDTLVDCEEDEDENVLPPEEDEDEFSDPLDEEDMYEVHRMSTRGQ